MADLLYDLLATAPAPSPSSPSEPQTQPSSGFGPPDHDALSYLATLATRPLSSLQSEEPLRLAQSAHSLQLALQGLAKKSYQPVLESAKRHAALRTAVPQLAASTAELRKAIPSLDDEALRFSTTYRAGKTTATTGVAESAAHKTGAKGSTKGAKGAKGDVLARRRQALLLSRNVERLVDVLELPPLLASSVAAVPVNYASALDLNGHIRRLHALFPDSPLVRSVASEADESMRATAASLVLSLKAPGLKLAASLRTISWLRRVLPDLEAAAAAVTSESTQALAQSVAHSAAPGPGAAARSHHDAAAQERALGAVFLVCRLATLTTTLDALAPLRELADQEQARQKTIGSANAWSGGQQTERYLKRYIEIFREQSFAIVSMFRSVFPTATASGTPSTREEDGDADGTSRGSNSTINGKMQRTSEHNGDHGSHGDPLETPDPLEALPPALATFPLHLVDMLLETLRQYLPAVRDQASRDSLLTQVLYCAGSLGRLGGDFGLFLATLDVGDDAEAEWVEVVRRHRQLAGRLESIVGDPREKR
ncbi:hypothetical protein HMPREF1624_07159 [Sporothrix schenckii ATCC 58251]|uniref:Conserved oligomeric Golgi complex subunit 8 n=1 Tax=Sporothrix schenckii (strain ATCC 58251 / de Perez 2211183) TaxID=1391915 RepID=U7PP19_SPOS1|nr:hypothetical protein HMPREF1624_07159 [Sporothrix schenckii ATCC 58251]